MVVRRRANLIPLMLYCISAGLVAYFWHHAHVGAHGLEAKQRFKIRPTRSAASSKPRGPSMRMELRIALLRSDRSTATSSRSVRVMLGKVHRNDLVTSAMMGP